MRIGYARPEPTLQVSGATALTALDRLANGRPQSRTRFSCTPGSATIQSNFSQIAPGIAGLIGGDLPIGTSVQFQAIRTGDGGYGYLSTTNAIVERRDGVRAVWFVFDNADPIYSCQFVINTSALPTSGSPATATFEIGEAWVSPAIKQDVLTNYQRQDAENSSYAGSVSGQPYAVRRQQSHQHSFDLAPERWAYTYEDSLKDLARVKQEITRHTPAVILPYSSEPFTGGTMSQEIINHHAAFGYFDSTGAESYDKGVAVNLSGLKFVEVAA